MLQGKKIVFSGFRNQTLKDRIEKAGGKVTTAVSSLTNILVVKDKNASSSKVEDARQKGIEIHDVETFIAAYFKNAAEDAAENTTSLKDKKQPKLKTFASYFDLPSKTSKTAVPQTVEAAEAWLKQDIKKTVYLQHGDILNFSEDRFGQAKFVVVDGDGKRRLVDNPDYSGSGYLSVPKEVTSSLEDAVKYYRKIIGELDYGSLQDIVLGSQDKRFKRIFKKETPFSKDALVVYVLDDEPFLRIEYKGKSEQFDLKDKQDYIEARFKALILPTRSMQIRFYLTAEITSVDSNRKRVLNAKLSPNLSQTLSLPAGVKVQKQNSNSITVIAPADMVWETTEAVSQRDFTIM